MKTAKQGSGPVHEDLGRPDAEEMMVSSSRPPRSARLSRSGNGAPNSMRPPSSPHTT